MRRPLGGTTVLVAGAPQERGIDRVQFRAARQRIQPDILVALAVVYRSEAKPRFRKNRNGQTAAFSSSVTE